MGAQPADQASALGLEVGQDGDRMSAVRPTLGDQQAHPRRVAPQQEGEASDCAQPHLLELDRLPSLSEFGRRCAQAFLARGERCLELALADQARRDRPIGLLQGRERGGLLLRQSSPFRRQRLEFDAELSEFALDGLPILRRRAEEHHRQHDGRAGEAHRAARRSRLSPVISGGCGRSMSTSTVGATSRSAPPARSSAGRPRYTKGTGPKV